MGTPPTRQRDRTMGLHGRREWILACAYCVGFGVLVATFLLQIWAFAGCPVFAQHC